MLAVESRASLTVVLFVLSALILAHETRVLSSSEDFSTSKLENTEKLVLPELIQQSFVQRGGTARVIVNLNLPAKVPGK